MNPLIYINNIKKYLFIYTLLSILSSCSFFVDSTNKGLLKQIGHSPFIIDQIKGRVVATRINGLPEEIQISYTACFRDDIHPDNTIQNSLFKIHFFEDFYSSKKTKKSTTVNNKECSKSSSFLFSNSSQKKSCLQIRTDSSGCLNWTEVYPYKKINQSMWFRYDRAFEGTGIYKGNALIPMAVNPWLAIDPSGSAIQLQLVDLRYHSIHKNWKLISLKNKQIPECHLCSLNKNKEHCLLCKNKKHSLSYIISYFHKNQSTRPRLWLNGLNSQINQEPIPIYKKNNSAKYVQVLKQYKVCHLDIKKNCDFPGRFFKVRLKMPLRIQVKNYRNETELLPLTRGKYLIKAYLFLKNKEGKHIVLHRDTGLISASLFKGSKEMSLTSEFYFHIPYEHYSLPAFLGLTIQEQDNPSFEPFEGVFSFPHTLRSVIGNNTLHLSHEALSFYKKNLLKNISLLDSYKFSGVWLHKNQGFRRAGWDVSLNRMRFSEVSLKNKECPTPIDRTIHYVGEVCIMDPLIEEVVPITSIEIKRQDIFFTSDNNSWEGEAVKIPITQKKDLLSMNQDLFNTNKKQHIHKKSYISDTTGCIQWVDSLYHKWYDREKYFVRKMIFSKKQLGFKGERTIAINPWQWGFMFFQDITQLGYSAVRTVATRAERPQVILHDFRSLFVNPIYTIDRWLGINIFQTLSFLFKIRVERPDNIASSQGGEKPSARNIRRGYYSLRFILVKSAEEESGGKGNQVINKHNYETQYKTTQPWNINTGWSIGRDGHRTGQVMNTNLEYITHFDTYVQIRDSMVNAYINLLFDLDQFIFIGSNNRLIVQLLPTDPQYYVYYPNSCEVDPKKSTFIAFTDHELISRPFMGTFVPGNQRNWNIFKPLKNTSVLNMNFKQLNSFIKEQKKTSKEHKLFTKLQTNLIIKTTDWSPKVIHSIVNSGSLLKKLYTDINNFLNTNPSPKLLTSFNQKKNKIIESLDEVILFISQTLKGSIKGEEQQFLIKLNRLAHHALSVLKSTDHQEVYNSLKKINLSFINIMQEQMPSVPLDLLKQQQNKLQKNKNTWHASGVSFSEESKDWSADNMNLFAKSEGLKVINMDNAPLVTTFLQDVNDISNIHNSYRDLNTEITPTIDTEDTLWNNFALISPKKYADIYTKIKQMYLPLLSKESLNTVINRGVRPSTINTPEVMTFLHSMCGFWFDKFYDKYLEQDQLNTIYDKHLDHFQYYKSTLQYFLKHKNAAQQYNDLYDAMKTYRLTPIDSHVLITQNPFRIQNTSNNTEGISFLFSIYENLKEATQSNIFLKSLTQNSLKNISVMSPAWVKLAHQTLKQKPMIYDHPFVKCIANPLNFFHIEKKIIVGDIGSNYSDLKYEYGYSKSFNLQRAMAYSYAASSSMSKSFSTALGTGFVAMDMGNVNPLKWVSPLMSFRGIRLDSRWETNRTDSDYNTRNSSLRMSDENLFLQINRSVITIKLKNYRHCITIRSKNLAFDGYPEGTVWKQQLEDNFVNQIPYIKSGLMICSGDIDQQKQINPFYITEDYFYMYQAASRNTEQFQSYFNFRNRPFVVSLRGATEMQKFSFLMQSFVASNKQEGVEDYNPFGLLTNPYNKPSQPIQGARQAILKSKVWDKTGFYPGVYNVRYNKNNYYYSKQTTRQANTLEKFGQWLFKKNPFDKIRFDDTEPLSKRNNLQ